MKKNILILILVIRSVHLLTAQDIYYDTASASDIYLDTVIVCPVNIEEIQKNSVLNVFPNPSQGTFRIVYKSTTPCPPAGWGGILIINITNLYNQVVYSETILEFDGEYDRVIDLSTLEKDVYTIIVVGSNLKRVKRELLQ